MNYIIISTVLSTFIACGSNAESASELTRESQWTYEDSDNDETYSISFWSNGNQLFLSYGFIYENGNRTNVVLEFEDYSSLTPLGDDCYLTEVRDTIEQPENKFEVSLCVRDEHLFWSMLSDNPPTFVPDYVIFDQYNF